ncbi:PH domain-containing protein [Georgenia sp. TF02-10]|uniref:PH domain-containing protein n=1 Tax=Georgenia sp. TF02-10 TaxID=2917725 RepID=UPI001FA78383|nr:PH domain-containing protein [Georgenia sp. TF02-10]UNX55666.1 PH domain-containing protein [Georgenia sp. TF02-10]
MGPTVVLRAAGSRGYAVLSWVVAAVLLVMFFGNGGGREVAEYGAVPLVLAVLGWAVFWRPAVLVSPAGVRVVNVFRTIEVPWSALEEVETRWGLRLHTTGGRVRAWATPARGGMAHRRVEEVPTHLLDLDVAGEFHITGSAEVAGQVIEARLAAVRAGNGSNGAAGPTAGAPPDQPLETGRVRRRLDVVPIAGVAGSGLLAVVTARLLG